MNRIRWPYMLAALLLGASAIVLLLSILSFPVEAQTEAENGRLSHQTAVPPTRDLTTSTYPAALARPAPASADHRTMTAPRDRFGSEAWSPLTGRPESRMTAAVDAALPATLNPQSLPAGVTLDLAYHAVLGWAGPGDLITVTTPTGYGAAQADNLGFFWTPIWHENGYAIPLNPGEPALIFINGALAHTVTPPAITGGVDVLTDMATGAIDGDSGGTAVALSLGAWGGAFPPGAPVQTSVTLPDGSFTAAFSQDLGAEHLIVVDIPFSGVNVRGYLYPDPAVFLVQQYDMIEGYGPPGQPVQATVYAEYPGNVRWSGETWADWPHGFYRFGLVGWNEVDIEVGDVVVVELDGGVTLSTTVIELSNLIFDVVTDQVQGTAPAGATIRASLWQWQDDELLYHEDYAIAGAGDQFTLNFTADLRPRDDVDLIVTDANGHQVHLWSGPPFVSAWNDPYSNLDCVIGRVDGPGLPITVSLTTPDQTYARETGWNSDTGNRLIACFTIRDPDWAWGPINFEPGNIATAKSPTWQGDVEIIEIDWYVDTAADSISGEAPAGDLEITAYQWNDWGYPLRGSATRTAVASSPFTANFSGFDLRDGNQLILAHFDAATGYGNRTADWGRHTLPYFEINLPHGVGGMSANPHEEVTASLYDADHNLLFTTSQDHDDDPYRFWLGDFGGHPLQTGYWITLTSASGWTAGMEIPHLEIDADPDTDMVTAVGPTGLLYLEGGREDSGFGAFVPGPNAVLDTTSRGHDLQWSDSVAVIYQAVNGNRARRDIRLGELYRVEFWLNPDGPDWMWGEAKAGTTVTITTPHAQVVVWADPACGGCWHLQEPIDVNPGDTVHVVAGEGVFPVTIHMPDPIVAEADSNLNEVWGQVGGWSEEWLEVHGWWHDGYRETMTDASGYFSVAYPDVPRGGQGNIRFGGWVGYTEVFIHQTFQTPDLVLRVNYGHDWVEGNYEAGHTMWLTVTDEVGVVKATASGETGEIPWWGGQTGFSTNYNIFWHGDQHPDIQPGDWVYAAMSTGYTATVRIGAINGVLDIDNDTVSGDIHAPWFSEPLNANCGVWEENGPGMGFTIDPNGGTYFCDFGDMGWDLQPGHMVGVEYQEPDGHQVINVFEEPAPRLFVQKWADGQPAEGGNFVFHIQYRNEGGATAENVVITDTMEGFVYLSDTGAFPYTTGVTPGGDPYVAWELGDLEPGDWAGFDLYVTVTAAAGNPVRNTAEIATSNPYNNSEPWQLESVWEGQAVENDTHLNVGKGTWTWDPAPGYDFVYNVNVCNNGSTGSAAVTLTDTLPLSTTLQSWWGQDGGWQLVDSGPHLLVVERPSLAAWSCSEVYLRVHLDEDAWPGMWLENTAVIHADNDLSPDDNEATMGHPVGLPYRDLAIWQNWHWGILVPGGHYRLGLHFQNQGNLPADGPVYVTATLPAGTSFAEWHSWGGAAVSLHEVTADHVVWEINGLDNGYYSGIELALNIDPDVAPGTALVNQAEITMPPGDVDPDNNLSVWTETVYPHGPNLRLRKDGDWHGHGEGHNAWYRLEVENIGDQTVNNVTITDNYAAEMNLDGGLNVGYWQWWDWADHPDDHFFTVTLESLQPGWNVHINYNMVIPGDDPVPFGLLFTNEARVEPLSGDTNPADNGAAQTLKTGPDLYVEKSLVAGDFLPGELVTYLLRFGNDQPGHAWWWNLQGTAWLTDTLPDGVSYVSAYQRWCGSDQPQWCERDPDEIDGQNLLWNMGPMGASHWNEILLTALIGADVSGLDTLTNWAIIASDQPEVDIEPFYDNNSSSHEAAVMLPYFTISKSYVSSRIAGLLVTYNLTVHNPGHAAGTGLVITDLLPDNVTYVSGGSYNAGVVSWNVANLPPDGAVQVQFVGRLGHSGQVINDQYRAASSNEGVVGEWGAAVSFAILPPTINANFTQSATSIDVGQAVSFNDTSTTNGAPIVAWLWNFGDGQTSAAQNPTHTYTAVGVYTVTLQVTDSAGHTAVHSEPTAVTVNPYHIYLPLVLR